MGWMRLDDRGPHGEEETSGTSLLCRKTSRLSRMSTRPRMSKLLRNGHGALELSWRRRSRRRGQGLTRWSGKSQAGCDGHLGDYLPSFSIV
jgi:hypothetical protein